MRKTILISIFIILLGLIESPLCMASSLTINPSADGYVNVNGNFITDSYLFMGDNDSKRGIIEFPLNSVDGQIETAALSLNPYSLPLLGKTVHVYGYSSNDGIVSSSDFYEGIFLGDWLLPDLTWGQNAYYNVTEFLQTVTTPYVGFNLRTENADLFSSLEINYGHPSQLLVTTIPEPATILLLGLGAAFVRKRKA